VRIDVIAKNNAQSRKYSARPYEMVAAQCTSLEQQIVHKPFHHSL
jgi:hypothetical protein